MSEFFQQLRRLKRHSNWKISNKMPTTFYKEQAKFILVLNWCMLESQSFFHRETSSVNNFILSKKINKETKQWSGTKNLLWLDLQH